MQMKKKMKKKGFILLPVIMGVIILGILGVGLTSLYTGTFSTLSAGKAASQAQNNAQIESEMIRVRGYDDAKAHDWQDMKAYLGDEEGEKWASKVEKVREEKDQENRNVKIMKVSVKKNGEIISRYSEEIPLVQGLDVYTKDEMDALLNQLHTEINNVNTDLQDLQDFKVSTNKNFATINKQIDQINKNLDTLSNRITAEEKARKNEDAAIRADIANKYSTIQTQITSLKDSLNDLKSALNKEISDRKTADTNLKNDYTSKITNLANTVNTKYSYLETLIQGLKGRLDGNEFVKSKAKQNISLQYLQGAGESKKTIHAFVDGVDVPLSSQADSPSPSMFSDQGGYYKFPNGLIMQWGRNKECASPTDYIYFPIPFPHKCLTIMTSLTSWEGGLHQATSWTYSPGLKGYERDRFIISVGADWIPGSGTLYRKDYINWLAIGY